MSAKTRQFCLPLRVSCPAVVHQRKDALCASGLPPEDTRASQDGTFSRKDAAEEVVVRHEHEVDSSIRLPPLDAMLYGRLPSILPSGFALGRVHTMNAKDTKRLGWHIHPHLKKCRRTRSFGMFKEDTWRITL